MEIKDFISKVVIDSETKKRYVLKEIVSPYIAVKEATDVNGGISIIYDTINGNPIKRGILFFEDATLTAPFNEAYTRYCRTKDAYWENYGYWLRR